MILQNSNCFRDGYKKKLLLWYFNVYKKALIKIIYLIFYIINKDIFQR